jgi:O-methyltransferase
MEMEAVVRAFMKQTLIHSHLPPLPALEKISNGLRFSRWLRRSGAIKAAYFPDRVDFYTHLASHVLQQRPVDYLEFGVFEGESVREWLRLNLAPSSRFFGFDTFEGLPEPWRHFGRSMAAGTFNTNGQSPAIDDPRVHWYKGLFQETLRPFLSSFRPVNQVVVHIDADLYSSALYVLTNLNPILEPGSITIFDEFSSVDNEYRAVEDFTSAFRRSYRVLACGGRCFAKVALEWK